MVEIFQGAAVARDETPHWEEWKRFAMRCRRRLAKGADEYRDESFSKDPGVLCDEVKEEIEDIAVWGFILWCRIDAMQGRLHANTVQSHAIREPVSD